MQGYWPVNDTAPIYHYRIGEETLSTFLMIPPGTVRLSTLTTLRLGGVARRFVDARSESELIAEVHAADRRKESVLILGGGSNLVVADAGFDGMVVRVSTSGTSRSVVSKDIVIEVQAGDSWDSFVADCVGDALGGLECLSGIPGSVGATPIQNVGAYGQEVSDTVVGVRAYDRLANSVIVLDARDCAFAYRSSRFKEEPDRWLILSVTYCLVPGGISGPIKYEELARELNVSIGDTAPLDAVRTAVLRLRGRKGMVLDASDPDTISAGSFFTNPVLTAGDFAKLEARVRELCGDEARPPRFVQHDGRAKTSAAWLIEHAGFRRGDGNPDGIAISSKHTLALTNRGRGTTAELMRLAAEIERRVEQTFGVRLVPEPVFLGVTWSARQ